MAVTLADLLDPKTSDEIVAEMIVALTAAGFQVTDWTPGGTGRTILEVDAVVLADLYTLAETLASGSLLSLSTGDWLTLLASDRFSLERIEATFAQGYVTLVDTASSGPHAIGVNDLWVQSASGLRFNNLAAVTIPLSGAVQALVLAEFAGASYNVALGALTSLGTVFPGVTSSNWFGGLTQTGTGLGAVVPAPNTTPSGVLDIVVKITVGGALGVAKFQWSVDAGATFNGADIFTSAHSVDPMSNDVDIYFADTAGVFVLNDEYQWALDTWQSVVAVNDELDENLRTRCENRWGDLGPAATAARYINWAIEADGSVTRAKAEENGVTAGQVDVTIAGSDGSVLGAGIVATVDAYIAARRPLTTDSVVAAAASTAVDVTGTVYHQSGLSATDVQAAVESALDAMEATIDIGGDAMGAGAFGLSLSAAVDAIMDSEGVVNTALITPAADTALGSTAIANITYAALVYTSV